MTNNTTDLPTVYRLKIIQKSGTFIVDVFDYVDDIQDYIEKIKGSKNGYIELSSIATDVKFFISLDRKILLNMAESRKDALIRGVQSGIRSRNAIIARLEKENEDDDEFLNKIKIHDNSFNGKLYKLVKNREIGMLTIQEVDMTNELEYESLARTIRNSDYGFIECKGVLFSADEEVLKARAVIIRDNWIHEREEDIEYLKNMKF